MLVFERKKKKPAFFERIPQKPLRVMFHLEPSETSRERFPEKIPEVAPFSDSVICREAEDKPG